MFKSLSQESPDQIRKSVSVFVENTTSLDLHVDLLIAMKLDRESRRQWELHTTDDDAQKMASMLQFSEDRARALNYSAMSRNSSCIVKEKSTNKGAQLYHTGAVSITKCLLQIYDVFVKIVGTETKAITEGLFAKSTVFGWVVSGKLINQLKIFEKTGVFYNQ